MNADQKQRALQVLRSFEQADPITVQSDNAAVDVAALLQELVDAPEPEPVGEAVDFNGWRIVRWEGKESDFQVGTKFYTSPPAPSVPEPAAKVLHVDGLLSNNLIDCDLPVGTLLYTPPVATERDLLGPADEIVKRYNAYPKLLQLISDARDELVQLAFCEEGLDELIEELTRARE